jgi:Co/Zn/Cd efflux system component
MRALGLGATLESTMPVARDDLARARASAKQEAQTEAGILKWLLAINGIMFVIEITVGWWAQSTGLIADSLDMFADAAVYGVALYAVGHSVRVKLRAAHFSGWLQIILALGALGEVVRRLVFGSEPVSTLMMSFGLVALAANVTCLLLIARSRDSGAHMKASWIFSANDVIANLGVILAGGLVAWTGSRYPDLVIGLIIGLIVLNGARRILQLKS